MRVVRLFGTWGHMGTNRHILIAAGIAVWGLLACTTDEPVDRSRTHQVPKDDGEATATEKKETATDIPVPEVAPLNDDAALAFLKGACLSCHHEEEGSVKSFWAMKPELTKEDLA